MFRLVILLFGICFVFRVHSAHLVNPVPRNTIWTYTSQLGTKGEVLDCGGVERQWNTNGGKCGVCGDPWDGPRFHEFGGKYAQGIVGGIYKTGSTVQLTIENPEKVGGYIEFRLCDVTTKGRDLHQSCFDKHVLLFSENKEKRQRVKSHETFVDVYVELPVGLSCKQCVLQWSFVQDNTKCPKCVERRTIRNCADIQITDRITRRKRQVQGWQNQHQDHTNLGKRVEWLGVQAKKTIDNHNAAKKPLVMKDAEIYRTELRKVESIAPKPSPPGIPNNNRQQYYQLQHQRALHRQNGQFGQQQNGSPTRYAQHNSEIMGHQRHRPSNQNFKLTQDARPKKLKKNQVAPSPAFINADTNPKPTPTQANQGPTSQLQHQRQKQGDQHMFPHHKQHKPSSMNQHNVQPTNQPKQQYQHSKHPNQPVYKTNSAHQQQYHSQFQRNQRRRQHQQQQQNQWYPHKQHHRQQQNFNNNNNQNNGWNWNQKHHNYQRMSRQQGSLSQTQNQPPNPSASMDGVGGAFSSQFDKPSGGLSSMPSENPSKTPYNDMVAKTHSGGFLASQESLLPRSSNPNQQYLHNRRPPTPPSSGLYPSNDVVPSVSSGNSPLSNFKGDTPISVDRPAMEMNPDTKQIRNFVQPAGFKEIPHFDFVHAPEVQRERIKPKIIQTQSTTPPPSQPQGMSNTGMKQPQTVHGNMGNQQWQSNGWQGFQPKPQPTPVQQPQSPKSPSLQLQSNTRSQSKQPPSSSPNDVPVKVQPNPQWLDSSFNQPGTNSNIQRVSGQNGWMSNVAPTPTKTSVYSQKQLQNHQTSSKSQGTNQTMRQSQWQRNPQNSGSNTQPINKQQQNLYGQQQPQSNRQAQMRQIGEGQFPSPTVSQQTQQTQQLPQNPQYENHQQYPNQQQPSQNQQQNYQNQQQQQKQQEQPQQELWKQQYLQAQKMRQANPSFVPYSQNQQNNPSYRIRPTKKPFTLNADPKAMRWSPKVARQFFGGLTVYDPKPSSSTGFQKPKASPPNSHMFPPSTPAPVTTTPAPVQRVNRWNAPPAPASPIAPTQNQHSMMSNVPSQMNRNHAPNFAQQQQFQNQPNQQQQFPNQNQQQPFQNQQNRQQQVPNQNQQQQFQSQHQQQPFQNQQQQQGIPSQNTPNQQSQQNTQQQSNQRQPPVQQAQNVAGQTAATSSMPVQNKGSKVLADKSVPGTKIKGINSPLFVMQSKADVNKHLDKTEAPPVTKASDKLLNIGEYNTGFKGNKNPLYVVGSPLMVTDKKSEPSRQIEIVPQQSSMVPKQPNSNNFMLNTQSNQQHVASPSTPAPQAPVITSAPRSFNPFLGSPRPLPNRQRPTGPLGSQKGFPNQANRFGSLFVQGAANHVIVTTSTPAPTTYNPLTTQGYRMGSLAAIGMGNQNLQGAVIAAAKSTTPSPPIINARQDTFSANGRGMFIPRFTRKLPQRYPQQYPSRNVNLQRPIYPRVVQNIPPTALAPNLMSQMQNVQTNASVNEANLSRPQTGLTQQQSVASGKSQPAVRGPPKTMTTLDAIIWDRAIPTTTETPVTQAPYDPSNFNRFNNQNRNQYRQIQYPNVGRSTQNRFGNRPQQPNQYPQKPSLSNPMSSGPQLSNWKGPSQQYQGANRGQLGPLPQWNNKPNNPNMFSAQNGQSQLPESKPKPVLVESPNTPAPTTGSRVNQFLVSGPKPPQRSQQQKQRLNDPQPAPIPKPVSRDPHPIKGQYHPQTAQKSGFYNHKADPFGAFLMGGGDKKSGTAAVNQIEKPKPNLQSPVRKEYVEPSNTVSQVKNPNAIYPRHLQYPSHGGGFGVVSGGLSPSKVHPMAVSRAKERLQPSESPKLSDLGNVFGREQRAQRLGSYQNVLQGAGAMPSAGNSEVLWAVRTTPAESKIIYQDALQNQAIADKGQPVPGYYRRNTVVEKQPQSVVPGVEAPRQQSLSNGPLPMELEKSRHSVKSQNPYPQPQSKPKTNNQPEPIQRPVPKTIEAPAKMAVIDPPVQKQLIQKEAPQQQLIEKQPAAEAQQKVTTTAKPEVRAQNTHLYRAPQYHQQFRFRSTGFGIPQVRPASSKRPSNGVVQYGKSP